MTVRSRLYFLFIKSFLSTFFLFWLFFYFSFLPSLTTAAELTKKESVTEKGSQSSTLASSSKREVEVTLKKIAVYGKGDLFVALPQTWAFSVHYTPDKEGPSIDCFLPDDDSFKLHLSVMEIRPPGYFFTGEEIKAVAMDMTDHFLSTPIESPLKTIEKENLICFWSPRLPDHKFKGEIKITQEHYMAFGSIGIENLLLYFTIVSTKKTIFSHKMAIQILPLLAFLPQSSSPVQDQKEAPVSQIAETTMKTWETMYYHQNIEPALGYEYRKKVSRAITLFQNGRLDDAHTLLDHIITFFEEQMTDTKTEYICVANKKEYDYYLKEQGEDKNIIWLDWAFRQAIHLKAFMASAQNQMKEALILLDTEIALAPYAAEPYIERGYILNQIKKHKEALVSYKRAFKLSEEFKNAESDKPVALRGMGFTLIELGMIDEAEEAYKSSLLIDPESTVAQNELEFLRQMKSSKKAE